MICRSCGQDNPDIAKFCLACGGELDEFASMATEERKVVSILFVDLVGFTARSHGADPEDVRAALGPYHALLKREIERFGGTVEKFIGDAVMAVFGAPTAHEDDAERAVRAGLRIIGALGELNEANPDLDLSIRAAVNTGEGLVALAARPEAGEGMVTGDVVNTASRLQNVAPINGVAVGELTYRSTRAAIDYQELDSVTLKGKPEPVRLWRATAARSRFGIEAQVSYTTPFVGRELDLGTLKHAYHRTLAESSLQLVTIVGEPGVGKTRLLAELSAYIDDQPELVSWRQGRCLPYGDGITFWALGEIVKAHAGILESDSATQASSKLSAAVATVIEDESERPWFVARLGALVGAGSTQPTGGVTTEESFTAWRRFLETVAVAGPLIVVFEDLHWGDAALFGFIDHLVEWAAAVPLMVVCTARPELYERHPGWGAGTRNATTISLSPLSDHETAELVSVLLSQAVLPAAVHAALLERAGGNPLYAEEFVRMLTDRGVVRRRGRAVSLEPGAVIAMPETVQALIAARLDTLPPEGKALLHDAAVAGKVFWSGALAAIGEVSEQSVIKGLHELTRKEIVRPARTSSMSGQQEYSFWHGLIKDVSYAQIPRAGRINKHLAMATWIETSAGDRVADHAEVLAHHYGEALALATVAGDNAVAEDLREPATRFAIAAGDRAAELDMATAETYYGRALELVGRGDSERAGLLIKAGMVALHRGRLEDAVVHLEEATTVARTQGNHLVEGYAKARLASVTWFRGETERSADLTTEAVELLEREPPGAELINAYHRLADIAQFSGDATTALEHAKQALMGAERIGDDVEFVGALAAHGAARCSLGDLEGFDDMKRALQEGLRLGLAGATSYAYSELSDWTWRNNGAAAGHALYKEAAEFEDRRGMTASASFTRAESLGPLFDLGRWDELSVLADALLGDPESSTYAEAIALIAKAHVTVVREQLSPDGSLTERLLSLARSIKDLQVLVPALAVTSLIHWGSGRGDAAVASISELEELTPASMWRARHLASLARILVSAGEADRARGLLDDVAAVTTRDRNSVVSAEAIVFEAHDELERALELYDDAAKRWTDYGFVLEQGYALFGSGRCLLRLGRREDTKLRLHEAGVVFSGLRASPLSAEVNAHLVEAEALSS